MTGFAWLCVAATAVLVGAEIGEAPALRTVAKPVASLAFVGHAVTSGALGAGAVGAWILAALALSVVGDVLLLSSQKRPFLGGLAAFLVGHLAYGAAFVALGVSPLGVLVAAVPLAAVAWGVWGWLGPRVGGMARPVFAYVVVISGMVALAAGAAAASPTAARLGLLGAAVLFFLSDLCVARNRFVAPGWVNRAIGLPLYYGAQLVFGGLAAAAAAGR